MATMNPFDDDRHAAQTRLPWMALVIIAMMTIVVGWMVFTATPSIADPTAAKPEVTIGNPEPLA
ncbi:MAG: hypothetical protein NVV72_10265 [Asticcacaulis sp.]|nr:hypothetical protein [Asticcacaulis sp.]